MTQFTGVSLRRQLLGALKGTLLVRVGAMSIALASSVVLARTLGVEGFGTYSFVFAIISVLAIPTQVGIPTLLIRETASLHLVGEWGRIRGLWRWAGRTILKISGATALFAAISIAWAGSRFTSDERLALIIGLVLIPLMALGNARDAALRGLRLIVRGQLSETIVRPLLFVFGIAVFWAIGWEVGPAQAMAWHLVAAAAAFATGAWILKRALPRDPLGPDEGKAGASWSIKSIVPLAILNGAVVLNGNVGAIALGLASSEREVGLFKVATSIAAVTVIGFQITNMVVAPYFSRLHEQGDLTRLRKLASAGAFVGVVLALPVVAVFTLWGATLLQALYGAEYRGAYLPVIILLVGQVLNAACGSVVSLLNMTRHERTTMKWMLAAMLVNAALCIWLVPEFGAAGAAIASTAALVVWSVALQRAAVRLTKVDGSLLGLWSAYFSRRH